MFIAISQFTVANDKTDEVKQAFRDRPHLVERAPGFVRMEVISPRELPAEIWLVTYWESEEAFSKWHHSHLYHESHKGIPKGLKLVPASVRLRFFDWVSS
ncbi:MAG: antibiotic biosynthesis monooxygenase [Acidobacteria bacterium]|nr:antibiotic biosynthesis monooxygenase [Acidobacteriota bacterium]MBV9435612.1 antibiotic biosynthesis monooxygenase [Acidobacteriota bacterium]